jgi:IS1 family transposase
MGFDRRNDSPACIGIRSCGWPAWPDRTPETFTTNSWRFPPETREIQLDEKWSFVAKKQHNCDPDDPADDHKGDWWDHVAYDAEHRLVLAVVPGARSLENAEEVVQEVQDRTAGRTDVLVTSDEYPAYETAIDHVYGVPEEPKPPGTPGRRPVQPRRHAPPELNYATVHKQRENGRVVAIVAAVILGTWQAVAGALARSKVSRTINTSLVERQHGTDRHHNARKARKTYRFSKDWRMHEAMTYFTMYSYNFCWPVRTLRERDSVGAWRQRTPAMAAGLADHVWSLKEWLTFPAIQ